jgi:hypothetical protein
MPAMWPAYCCTPVSACWFGAAPWYIALPPEQGSQRRMTRPNPKEIKAVADVAGVPVGADVAERIANSIGPAFESFAAIAGTLPFDLEPATFVVVQAASVSKSEKAAS